jgi:Gas vesicle synthesis protein GvpL/GvpF
VSTYVYALVRADHPLGGRALPGVGEPPVPTRLLAEGGLAAVVSDAPEGLRAKRRELMAHQRVIAALCEAGPVLPMRFGSMSPHDGAVRAVLAERGEHYLERLAELDGRVEFNVKAAHHEEVLLRRVVSHDRRIHELNERTRAGGFDAHKERLLLGELVTQAVRDQEAHDRETIRAALRPLAHDDTPGPELGECLCNHSFLVDRRAAHDFQGAVQRLEAENDHLRLTLHGPLAPYSFVEPSGQRQRA